MQPYQNQSKKNSIIPAIPFLKPLFLILLIGFIALAGCTTSPGKTIPFTILNQGEQSPFIEATQKVFSTQGEFEAFMAEHHFAIDGLNINHDRESVVLIALGEKSTGGYSIQVTRVTQVGSRTQIQFTTSAPRGAADAVITHPYVLFKIGKKVSPGAVQFIGSAAPNPEPGTPTTEWLAYRVLNSYTNPWQTAEINFVKAPTETERASAWLSSQGVQFTQMGFVPHDEITCESLNCPRGDYLYVHASDGDSISKLKELGFVSPTDAFALAQPNAAQTHYTLYFVNPSAETLYYGGCNAYTPRIYSPTATAAPLKECFAEGKAQTLAAQSETTFTDAPTKGGIYDYEITYGTQCTADTPLSQADCAQTQTIHSNKLDFSTLNGKYVQMEFAVLQCNSNPWQVNANGAYADDQTAFEAWLTAQDVHFTRTESKPRNPAIAACTACTCPTGARYTVIVPTEEQSLLERLGFTRVQGSGLEISPPDYSSITWLVYNPYQCYTNQWPVPKQPVKSIETDMQSMQTWLEGKDVHVDQLALLKGITSLNVKCGQRTDDVYAVGVSTDADVNRLRGLGFVFASTTQQEKFNDTSDVKPISLIYKSKFCSLPPWKDPVMTLGSEAAAADALRAWLDGMGIDATQLTLHKIPVSSTQSCDTESGMAAIVEVPTWAKVHLGPFGFGNVSTTFDTQKTQVYPQLNSAPTPTFASVQDYYGSIDYSCQVDSDCEIKDVGSACGTHPKCTNKNAYVNPQLLQTLIQQDPSIGGGSCGFPFIDSCRCIQNTCRSFQGDVIINT